MCSFGANCRRKNPIHFSQYQHPEQVAVPSWDQLSIACDPPTGATPSWDPNQVSIACDPPTGAPGSFTHANTFSGPRQDSTHGPVPRGGGGNYTFSGYPHPPASTFANVISGNLGADDVVWREIEEWGDLESLLESRLQKNDPALLTVTPQQEAEVGWLDKLQESCQNGPAISQQLLQQDVLARVLADVSGGGGGGEVVANYALEVLVEIGGWFFDPSSGSVSGVWFQEMTRKQGFGVLYQLFTRTQNINLKKKAACALTLLMGSNLFPAANNNVLRMLRYILQVALDCEEAVGVQNRLPMSAVQALLLLSLNAANLPTIISCGIDLALLAPFCTHNDHVFAKHAAALLGGLCCVVSPVYRRILSADWDVLVPILEAYNRRPTLASSTFSSSGNGNQGQGQGLPRANPYVSVSSWGYGSRSSGGGGGRSSSPSAATKWSISSHRSQSPSARGANAGAGHSPSPPYKSGFGQSPAPPPAYPPPPPLFRTSSGSSGGSSGGYGGFGSDSSTSGGSPAPYSAYAEAPHNPSNYRFPEAAVTVVVQFVQGRTVAHETVVRSVVMGLRMLLSTEPLAVEAFLKMPGLLSQLLGALKTSYIQSALAREQESCLEKEIEHLDVVIEAVQCIQECTSHSAKDVNTILQTGEGLAVPVVAMLRQCAAVSVKNPRPQKKETQLLLCCAQILFTIAIHGVQAQVQVQATTACNRFLRFFTKTEFVNIAHAFNKLYSLSDEAYVITRKLIAIAACMLLQKPAVEPQDVNVERMVWAVKDFRNQHQPGEVEEGLEFLTQCADYAWKGYYLGK